MFIKMFDNRDMFSPLITIKLRIISHRNLTEKKKTEVTSAMQLGLIILSTSNLKKKETEYTKRSRQHRMRYQQKSWNEARNRKIIYISTSR